MPYIVFTDAQQMQHRPRQIDAADLRQSLRGTLHVRRFAPQSDAHTRPRSSRAPRALIGSVLRDRRQVQAIHANRRVELLHACKAGIDDARYAFDRHGCLCDIRCQHDAPLRLRRQRAILLLRRQIAMQRQHQQIVRARDFLELTRGLANLLHAWEKAENIAIAVQKQSFDGACRGDGPRRLQ